MSTTTKKKPNIRSFEVLIDLGCQRQREVMVGLLCAIFRNIMTQDPSSASVHTYGMFARTGGITSEEWEGFEKRQEAMTNLLASTNPAYFQSNQQSLIPAEIPPGTYDGPQETKPNISHPKLTVNNEGDVELDGGVFTAECVGPDGKKKWGWTEGNKISDSATKEFGTGAVRSNDTADFSWSSMPWAGIVAVARTAGEGARKYGRFNYALGIPAHTCIDHAIGHIAAYQLGDDSEPHLAHAAWNLLAAIHSETFNPEINVGHRLSPGAVVGSDLRATIEAGKPEREAFRKSPACEAAGKWRFRDLPLIQRLLGQRKEAK